MKYFYSKITDNFPAFPADFFDPEVALFFRSLVWWCSLRKFGCTLGQRMLSMQYENFHVTRWLKWLDYSLRIVLPYSRWFFRTYLRFFVLFVEIGFDCVVFWPWFAINCRSLMLLNENYYLWSILPTIFWICWICCDSWTVATIGTFWSAFWVFTLSTMKSQP